MAPLRSGGTTAKVFMTQATLTATASASPTKVALHDNLLATAHNAGHFKHLTTAIKAAGMTATLNGPGPYTVFAPTDQAFDKLPKNQLDDLLKPENKAWLIAILQLHIVAGHVKSGFSGGKPATLKSVQGEDLSVDTAQGLRVNQSRVVERDLEASNGVIHSIDAVLMPAAS